MQQDSVTMVNHLLKFFVILSRGLYEANFQNPPEAGWVLVDEVPTGYEQRWA